MCARKILNKYIFPLFLLCAALLFSVRAHAVGWTPTDGGLVVDLQTGDRFLLSVWLDLNDNKKEDPGEEYFVYNYNRVTRPDDIFKYKDGLYLKLFPQPADATEPSEMTIWTVGAPLVRGKYDLGGIAYTIWNDGKTLKTYDTFKFLGDLTSSYNDDKAVDVVFIVPTDQESRISFDPNKTLKSIYKRDDQLSDGKINSKLGKGFLGMTYREVYMLDVPRNSSPISYTNASLVTFNTTNKPQTWSEGQYTCDPGHAAYAFADNKHKPTHRILFRLYMLDKPLHYCESYFFATDEQDVKSYRKVNDPKNPSDWTTPKKIYTWDHFTAMTPVNTASSPLYKTEYMNVPVPDSTYYYVGWNNDYRKVENAETMGSNGAHSQFTKIRELPLTTMPEFKAPAGAYGKMVVDTTSSEDNMDVKFEPAGYFLKIKETGKNIRLHQNTDSTWTCEEMWTISGDWALLHIRTMLMTGPEFREDDEGAPVEGWSKWVRGDSVPTSDGKSIVDKSGYAQITINNTDSNGHMVFVLADHTKWIRYDNNGYMGLEMPLQYPLTGSNTVALLEPRIKPEYTFKGWNTKADGSGMMYQIGDPYTFTDAGADTLYAQATYEGALQIAISFIHPVDSQRYFLTHPSTTSSPRYARARHFDSWENTWQGMEDAENADPNYMSTFEMVNPVDSIHRYEEGADPYDPHEMVLDPKRYTMKGFADSLTFYEFFAPAHDVYIGLYYERMFNTILANNTWAGLFKTTSTATPTGWPDYKMPYIHSTKLHSERYVEAYSNDSTKRDSLILRVRKDGSGNLPAYVKYNDAEDQFDGVATADEATDFQMSAVIVADEHYIVLPDTAYAWSDTIEFPYHKNEQMREDVWSALIGKQLMAVMFVDGDTVYFHPNRNKIISDPNNLYLSPDFRVTQIFEWIPDSRLSEALNAGDSVQHETTSHYWHHQIVSGLNSPMDVRDREGKPIDIVDTFRIHLTHDGISKIKEYRGRWNPKTDTLVKLDNANGSARHRDIIVRTKTYHYGDTLTRYVLKPKKESYTFGPLVGQATPIRFILTREHYSKMMDKDYREAAEEIVKIDTLTDNWSMHTDGCRFDTGNESFAVSAASDSTVTIRVIKENTMNTNFDTLFISSVKINNVVTAVEARVPLQQAALTTNELVWSVMDTVANKRYFIMAVGSSGSYTLQFREFTQAGSMLYEQGTKNQLVKGSNAGNNSDGKYITPWTYTYKEGDKNQLSLLTEYGISKYFATTGANVDDRGTLSDGSVYFTYRIAEVNTNPNSNYEEKVRIKYLDDKWLKFDGSKIVLQSDSLTATVFSWSYLLTEYSLLNNGTYPSLSEVSFIYNNATPKSIQTRYKAQREYSTLLDNEMTYLCRKEENRIDSLTSALREWKTTYTIDTLRDRRTATLSGIDTTINRTTLTTTVNVAGNSPTEVKDAGGKYINIVDTLYVTLGLQENAPTYRFKGDWSEFKSLSDANLKIPLIRKTYHEGTFSTLTCSIEGDDENFTFPADGINTTHDYILYTTLHEGTQMLDVDNTVVAITSEKHIDVTKDSKGGDTIGMHLNNKLTAEVRLMDTYGNAPDWCVIDTITSDTVRIRCTKEGIRSPRSANLYLAYIITLNGKARFINYRMSVSQASNFQYANNQTLRHSHGASGDEMMPNGMQQVHENKRILYYYPDQDVELPVRERAFYGWWRWYREGVDVDSVDVSDTDIPDSLWRNPPRNEGKWIFPYRIIGDSVWADKDSTYKKLVTMGRWTIFHYKSFDYGNKNNPPAQNPRLVPPDTMRVGSNRGKHPVVTFAVDISNYYDNLPMSLKDKNQVDAALMDTMLEIIEPTLSLREIFELHPWTEMADTLDHYKSDTGAVYPLKDEKYMEDHVMMAPTGYKLLLRTEQRYIYENLAPEYDKNGKMIVPGHSESLLGYYMHDDNWASMPDTLDKDGWSRKDSMIWCGGWDADCKWYTYNPTSQTYTLCDLPISKAEDMLQVPAKGTGAVDTVYYCLRARSKATTGTPGDPEDPETTEDGAYWFNICRYKIIYHDPDRYGPKQEKTVNKVTKALITNEEIDQRYDVLERLDFDYIQPGPDYHVYPHPLPWADASYGYTYPETSDLPHNRYHTQSDFPNHGEYGLINRIPDKSHWTPQTTYWRKMEQHGGASNGYMIYCDGMASAGQVAALTLKTTLCAGQKMFFSGYVGNPSSQTGKADPNFIFSVQGSWDGIKWHDITSYLTGDIPPSDNWYQIYFPILHNEAGKEYTHFRVRIYNVAANFDGNDFVIDDMCIFATKPPLIAYQAQTTCSDYGQTETDTHVLLRIDYQGITGEGYNDTTVCYTVRQMTRDSAYSFVPMSDGYLAEDTVKAVPPATSDTLFGRIFIPSKTYDPKDKDSIYKNMNDLLARFDSTFTKYQKNESVQIVREGYIYEILEGDIRPVKYIVHSASMKSINDYTVHMSGVPGELLSSICGMTSHLNISNRMVLELNGEEQPETEQLGLCANETYDISLRVKGSMYRDSIAPIDVSGSCINDWLLYGDTSEVSSLTRYGFKYSDIKKTLNSILRYAPASELEENGNQFAANLASIDRAELNRVYKNLTPAYDSLSPGVDPYALLDSLVTKGFLTLYKPKLTASVKTGDSVQYVIFPIVGTGSQAMSDARVEVCPNPILIKLKPNRDEGAPLMVGGLRRDSTASALPVNVLAYAANANSEFKLRVDSIRPDVGIYSIELRSTDDPNYREGLHRIRLLPDITYPTEEYYVKGDSIILHPASSNNYSMRPGYNYTFDITMQTWTELLEKDGCKIGTVPFTLSIVPDFVRWNPQSAANNNWNDADNWIGIDANNKPLHDEAHFVPMENTHVLIPAPEEGKPYPVVQPIPSEWKDSIQKVNFQYNQCNTIRFLPDAAIGNQQYINNTAVAVDMKLPDKKWAFRSAPVKGLISGDLFMADADLNNETPLWEVGEFDAAGRTYKTGNASFWLSVYNTETQKINHTGPDSTRTASADWSKVTNAIRLPLEEGKGLAIYARTKSEKDAVIRLPKTDDTYYYYGTYGERLDYKYEDNLQTYRQSLVTNGKSGDLIYHPDGISQSFTLKNGVESSSFVFGNPTMGYIDIWGFIEDNPTLSYEFTYMDESNKKASLYTVESKESALATTNELTNRRRYLPPMHAIVLKNTTPETSLVVALYTNRVVTEVSEVESPALAPARRRSAAGLKPGIMTVIAKNPCSPRCTSRLLIGQGYHNAIREGEDAILTTINIDNYSNTNAPATPFNIYASEGNYGLSIDLRDEVLNIPIAFHISDLSYEPVTNLWFTGVNNIDGQLVLYDEWTDTERPIIDGICLTIETPQQSHQKRYFIRRKGYNPDQGSTDPDEPGVATGVYDLSSDDDEAIKIVKDGHILIVRNGHVYTVFGQKVR